ncbi:histidine phosphatase family protein [Marinobacter alexandrii]|uniref:histidine phosphatase family protein n=1 Tax=Marinobacter alexandrii TaxID=2570351 RepID=UPI001FFF83D4|nr:histidine phosphatase family protein [Marinobacter alexandrii]MCK2149352.1 histidine phosphatase family protein [Marinobacter alexandrii]
MTFRAIFFALFSFGLSLPLVAAEDSAEAWEALRSGEAILMMRHALAPGMGDPARFELGDCSTQRNLNDEGRAQARFWKPFLAEHGIDEARVYSSQWCRCMDTATEMNVGDVTGWPPLNSFFQNRSEGPRQTRETTEGVNDMGEGAPIILVSHQVNTTALTGVYPASNEGVIIALPLSESPEILARVSPCLQCNSE